MNGIRVVVRRLADSTSDAQLGEPLHYQIEGLVLIEWAGAESQGLHMVGQNSRRAHKVSPTGATVPAEDDEEGV